MPTDPAPSPAQCPLCGAAFLKKATAGSMFVCGTFVPGDLDYEEGNYCLRTQRDRYRAEAERFRGENENLNKMCLGLADKCGQRLGEVGVLREALAFIATHGGDTPTSERPVSCNGSWCAEQARMALDQKL